MTSLVADYSDSDISENEGQDSASSDDRLKKHEQENINYITGDNMQESDDEICTKQDEEAFNSAMNYLKQREALPQGIKLPNQIANNPLPSPSLNSKVESSINIKKEDSVFANKFRNDEEAKLSILEKHVKITTIEKNDKIGGRQVCWQFRKGRCKKGHRCRFAHDNDIPLNNTESDSKGQTNISSSNVKRFKFGEGYFSQDIEVSKDDAPDIDSYITKTKKRHGIKDGMIPPKKALTDLEKQRAEQRPWTVNQ